MDLMLRSRLVRLLLATMCVYCGADDGPPAVGTMMGAGGVVLPGTGGAAGAAGMSAVGGGGRAGGSAGAGGAGGTSEQGGHSTDDGGQASSDAALVADAGSPPCTTLFCEDFESGLDLGKWMLDTQGGTATVVSDRVGHGSKALHVVLNAQGDHAVIVRKAPVATTTHVFGRVYFYLSSASSSPPSPAHTVYFTAGDGLSQKHYEVGGYDKGWQLSYWFPGGENIAGGGTVPVNQWACVEWEFDDAPNGTIRIFIDGTKNAEFTNAGGGNKVTAFQTLTWVQIPLCSISTVMRPPSPREARPLLADCAG